MWRCYLVVLLVLLGSGCTTMQSAIKSVVPTPQPPPFRTRTFTVSAGQSANISIDWLEAGKTIEGYFLVEGGRNDIGFRTRAPSGKYMVDLPRVAGRYDFRYLTLDKGPYTLTFDNTFSVFTGKHVTLVMRAY